MNLGQESDLIARIVEQYFERSDLIASDDPMDDFKILSLIALEILSDKKLIDTGTLLARRKQKPSLPGTKAERMIADCANILHAINPEITAGDWSSIFELILSKRYGGEPVRIKGNPKNILLGDAAEMTPKELMEKHRISRRYAYQIRKEALTKK